MEIRKRQDTASVESAEHECVRTKCTPRSRLRPSTKGRKKNDDFNLVGSAIRAPLRDKQLHASNDYRKRNINDGTTQSAGEDTARGNVGPAKQRRTIKEGHFLCNNSARNCEKGN